MNPLLFALMLARIATELPEKFNSITWTWKGRDTLAVGNITGAMVFQSYLSCLLRSALHRLEGDRHGLLSAIIALASAALVLGQLVVKKRISPVTLLIGGALYIVYAAALLLNN